MPGVILDGDAARRRSSEPLVEAYRRGVAIIVLMAFSVYGAAMRL